MSSLQAAPLIVRRDCFPFGTVGVDGRRYSVAQTFGGTGTGTGHRSVGIRGSRDSERMATYFVLNTGAKIPSVGLGTWQADNGLVGDAVYAAVKVSPLLPPWLQLVYCAALLPCRAGAALCLLLSLWMFVPHFCVHLCPISKLLQSIHCILVYPFPSTVA